ncbi:TonB family protein [Sphingobacterium hungaricum]
MFAKIYYFLIVLFVLSTHSSFAQDTTYYDSTKNKKVKSKTKAEYYDVVEYGDDKKSTKTIRFYSIDGTLLTKYVYVNDRKKRQFLKNGINQDFFKNGQVKEEETYVNGLLEGKTKKWYESGKIYFEIDYVKNLKDGQLLVWYEDGKPKRIDTFKEDKLIEGKCFDENGQEIAHFDFYINPEYPGGIINARRYIANNYKYPRSAITDKLKGTIKVLFVVEKDGSIADVEVEEGLSPDVDDEAIHVVESMKNWRAGMMDGKPVRVKYRLPIRLDLSSSR